MKHCRIDLASLFVMLLILVLPLSSQAQQCSFISPASGFQGDQALEIQITGQNTHFVQGSSQVSFEHPWIEVLDVRVESILRLYATIDIGAGVALGLYDVRVTTNGEVVTCPDAFEVKEHHYVTLTVGSAAGDPGTSGVAVALDLDNPDDDVSNVLIDVCDGDDYLMPSAGICQPTARASDLSCLVSEQPDGCARILLLPSAGGYIAAGSGPILSFTYDVSSLAPENEHRMLVPQNPQLASYNLRGGIRITDPIIAEDVTLVPGSFSFCVDGDGDGLCSSSDNCPLQANSPSLGTCVRSVGGVPVGTGVVCLGSVACGLGQTCQKNQEDTNANSIGDACECYADISGSAGVRDGKVDSFDLLKMKQQFNRTGCTPETCPADLNGDSKVDSFDLLIMKVQFNKTGCPVP